MTKTENQQTLKNK